jgi:hypothetical protein
MAENPRVSTRGRHRTAENGSDSDSGGTPAGPPSAWPRAVVMCTLMVVFGVVVLAVLFVTRSADAVVQVISAFASLAQAFVPGGSSVGP